MLRSIDVDQLFSGDFWLSHYQSMYIRLFALDNLKHGPPPSLTIAL